MGESSAVVSAYTLYRHSQQYCSHPSIYAQLCIKVDGNTCVLQLHNIGDAVCLFGCPSGRTIHEFVWTVVLI